MYLKCVAKYKLSQLRINDGFFFFENGIKSVKSERERFWNRFRGCTGYELRNILWISNIKTLSFSDCLEFCLLYEIFLKAVYKFGWEI